MRFTSLLLCLIPFNLCAQAQFITKQELNKVRYISKDGKTTYYQNNSGKLQFSTNYNFHTLLKKVNNTQYLVYASVEQQRILISADESHFSSMDLGKNKDIFIAELGTKKAPQLLGKGVHPALHLKDNWASFYDRVSRKIIIKNLVSKEYKTREIKLSSKKNFYFTPTVMMITPNDVIYTDINKDGYMALLIYSFIDKSFQTIYKTTLPGHNLNFCRLKEKVYLGEFSFDGMLSNSSILSFDLFNNPKFEKITSIYTSELPDIGNLHCLNDKLYFIKTIDYNKKLNRKTTEVATIDTKTNNLELLSQLKYVNQIIVLGNLVLTSYKDKYYLIAGKKSLFDDRLEKGSAK
ncbi:MAG: hypothetical protein HON90_17370 [Halobacteriovoraceae bacterium]|nr:hypothetical protein [Halobacteriovoraceae bacterium]